MAILVKKQDIHNITLKYNTAGHKDDSISISAWTEEMKSIQFYSTNHKECLILIKF